MTPTEVAGVYYAAWKNNAGNFDDVPLAPNLQFTGPVASFSDATEYRQMASQAGPAVTSFTVREQFVAGNRVCSIIDWKMSFVPGLMTAAELLEIEDGQIVKGELIYDAEDLRRAMARMAS